MLYPNEAYLFDVLTSCITLYVDVNRSHGGFRNKNSRRDTRVYTIVSYVGGLLPN